MKSSQKQKLWLSIHYEKLNFHCHEVNVTKLSGVGQEKLAYTTRSWSTGETSSVGMSTGSVMRDQSLLTKWQFHRKSLESNHFLNDVVNRKVKVSWAQVWLHSDDCRIRNKYQGKKKTDEVNFKSK